MLEAMDKRSRLVEMHLRQELKVRPAGNFFSRHGCARGVHDSRRGRRDPMDPTDPIFTLTRRRRRSRNLRLRISRIA